MPGLELDGWLADGAAEKVYLGLLMVVGLLMCLRGYRLFKVLVTVLGVLIGAGVGMSAGLQLSQGNAWAGLGGAVVLAALGGVLMFALYLLGVFVLGSALGVSLAVAATRHAGPPTQAITITLLALLGGILALVLQRGIITLATAFNGALLAVSAGWMLWRGVTVAEVSQAVTSGQPVSWAQWPREQTLLLGLWLVMGVLGALVQFSSRQPAPQIPPSEHAFYDDQHHRSEHD
jgi:hypothetical protein